MRLSTQNRNSAHSIYVRGRNIPRNSENISSDICSLYYLDYLFKMKELKSKFNGKIIPSVTGDVVIKNSVKHLQTFLSNELGPETTISRASNTVNFEDFLFFENNNYQNYIQNLKDNCRDLIINNNNFSNETTSSNYSMIAISHGFSIFSSMYLRSLFQEKFEAMRSGYNNRFAFRADCHSVFGERYRVIKVNQIGSITYNISKMFFERPYIENVGYQTVLSGNGSQLATDVFTIPLKIKDLRCYLTDKMGNLIRNNYEIEMDLSEFAKLAAFTVPMLINLKNGFDHLFRNSCSNQKSIITNMVNSNIRNFPVDPLANLDTNLMLLRGYLNLFLSEMIDKFNCFTSAYNNINCPDLKINVNFQKFDILFLFLSTLNGFFMNFRGYGAPFLTPAGVANLNKFFETSADNPLENTLSFDENGLSVNNLKDYIYNRLKLL